MRQVRVNNSFFVATKLRLTWLGREFDRISPDL